MGLDCDVFKATYAEHKWAPQGSLRSEMPVLHHCAPRAAAAAGSVWRHLRTVWGGCKCPPTLAAHSQPKPPAACNYRHSPWNRCKCKFMGHSRSYLLLWFHFFFTNIPEKCDFRKHAGICRDKKSDLHVMGFWKWFPPSCSWIALWMRDLRKTFISHHSLSSNLFQNYTVRVFTIGGQNDWSFSGRHESLDGCEEANIIIKYDINLWEQTVVNGSTRTKRGLRAVSYSFNYMSFGVGLPNGLPLQTEWVMWLSFCSVPLFDQSLVMGCSISCRLAFQMATGHRSGSDLLWPSSWSSWPKWLWLD